MQTNTYEPHIHKDPSFPFIFHMDVVEDDAPIYLHWHEGIELLYFLDNAADVILNGIPEHVQKGDIVVINSNRVHKIVTTEAHSFYYCLIMEKTFCSDFGFDIENSTYQDKLRDQEIARLVLSINNELERKQPHYKEAVKSYVLSILVRLNREYLKDTSSIETDVGQKYLLTRNAIAYMQKNYTQKFTISQLAEQLGYNKYYLCHTFKEVTGYSPISFLNLLRCTRAQEYLTSGRFNVSETAALCGFENLSYFSRTYKKHMGMLPSSKQ